MLYFVMPFMNGGSLQEVFAKYKKANEINTRFYVAQIVLGVGQLHELSVIHRDLKPGNVMLDSLGYVKVIDYGLARILENSSEKATTCLGTPLYVAPEVLKEDGYSYGADWWAIGILLHRMIFGVTPFQAG